MNIQEHIPLAPLTTFHIGGPARYFVCAKTIDDLREARVFARDKSIPLFVLGGGSNVLIADEGFHGLVVKMDIGGIEICADRADCRHRLERPVSDTRCLQSADSSLLVIAAGESWDDVVQRAIAEGLRGIENLSGIPGTFGGAVVQNIGAYGQAMSEVIEWAEVFDLGSGQIKRLSAGECAFDYRDSVFKHNAGLVVMRAALLLSKQGIPNVSYRDLKNYFKGKTPAIADIRAAVLDIRKGKFPDLSREGSAGSYFKNPMLPRQAAEKLRERYADMPIFTVPESSNVKVPLAWLLDNVLHLNGYRLGSARLFEKQPIVIAADRGATASDVLALADSVRAQARLAFGFEIEEEVRVIR